MSQDVKGNACSPVGIYCNYYLSSNYTGISTWTISGASGTIVQAYSPDASGTSTSQSGTNINNITVKWGTSGSGTVTFAPSSGASSYLNVNIANALNPGIITANKTQTLSFNGLPATINCAAASYGACSPVYAYQWQQSTNQTSWTDMSGMTSQNLSFPTTMTQSGYFYYRRAVTETTSGTTDYSDIATIQVGAPFTTTIATPSTQSIFSDGTSTTITSSAASGGSCSGSYGYMWQSSTDGINYTDLGVGGLSYQPPVTLGKKYYRLKITCSTQTAYSTVSDVNVFAHLSPGSISPSAVTITYNTAPSLTTSAATGGMCTTYSYQWFFSVDGTNYTSLSNANGQNFNPGNLTTSTYFKRQVSCGSETVSTTVLVTVNPQLFGGTISPDNLTIAANTNPGMLTATPASGGGCSGNYNYQWQSSPDGSTFSPISGAINLNYSPGIATTTKFYRVQVSCGIDIGYSTVSKIEIGTPYASQNFIRTRTVTKPLVLDPAVADNLTALTDVNQTMQYFDGLGRLIQTINKQASPTSRDVVSLNEYDEFGREVKKYLPYVASSNDGLYKPNAMVEQNSFNASQFPNEQFYYGKTDYESSPLNSISKTYAPGNSWVGSNKGVSTNEWGNNAIDAVRIWTVTEPTSTTSFATYSSNALYQNGALYKSVTTDENAKQVIEFKDKEGKIILKKVQLTATSDNGSGSNYPGWLCTYYIYDDFNNLRCVIQPKGVDLLFQNNWNIQALNNDILNEQCFRYEYDRRNRMTMKKVPGAGEVYMVYDKRDRLVFTQDANQRPQNKWLYTLYDDFNRSVQTGIMTYNGFAALQNYVDGPTVAPSPSTVSGSNVDATVALLILPTREAGVRDYVASSEIQFTNGFVSEDGADFTAQIGNTSNSTFTSPMSINLNPVPSGVNLTALTYTFYDNYNWTTQTYSTTDKDKVSAGTNLYLEDLPGSNNTKVNSLVTGTRVRVIEDPANLAAGKWLETVSFYDEKQRPIQVQSVNVTGGKDITTSLFDFSGKLLSTFTSHEKLGGTAKNYSVATKNTYNAGGRLVTTEKNLNNSGTWKTVSTLAYNALGQLQTKSIGTDPVTTSKALETLTYDYNIRGWLLGMNRDYAKTPNSTTNYFGFDLGYDKTDIKPSTGSSIGSFSSAAFNGNIAGMVWKSTGDDQIRKYDFTYDAVNRLTAAIFKQYSTANSVFDLSDKIDFTVSNLSYDANGNILKQDQNGLLVNSSSPIDKLTYTYVNNSNRLQNVIDDANNTATKLGDFRSSSTYMAALGTKVTANASTYTDYSYDANGNLTIDKNKDITGMIYNHLNLPQTININGKGAIQYVYDATGNKLKKIVKETGKADKTTLYLFGTYQDEILQFLPQEEGRIRMKDDASFVYDYFLKDHLGNVRTVLTEEQQTNAYPVASLETATLSNEKLFYSIPDAARTDKSTIPAYPADTYTNPNQWIQKLKGDATKIGTAIVLKVMAGDKVNIRANSWWTNNNAAANPGNTVSPITDIVNALITAVPAASGAKVVSGQLDNTILSPSVTDLINNRNTNNYVSTKPKAYLNWILLDDQFNEVLTNDGKNSGFEQVGADNIFTTHTKSGIELTKNGYLYVYVSNESTDINVFFDNLQVTHVRGPLLEETHYYPFGLTMSGISSKAAGSIQNRNKFNGGNELQNQEFSDGSGLETYDAVNRMYDPQLGRFFQIDEFGEANEDVSSYSFSHNNPIVFNDPLGLIDGLPGEKPADLGEVIVKSYNTNQRQQIYWDLRNSNTSFDRVSNKPLRDWLQNHDQVQLFMENVHKQTHEQDEIALEVATWLIPEAEILKILKVKKLFGLFKLKRGLAGLKAFEYASAYGIKSYKELKALTKGAGLEVHHLMEKRFAGVLGEKADEMMSIVVTKGEHQAFTNAWRAEIGYEGSKAGITTGTALRADVEAAAQKIYKDYPEILNALGLK